MTAYDDAVGRLAALLYTGGRGRITPEAVKVAVRDVTDALHLDLAELEAVEASRTSQINTLLSRAGVDDGEYTPSTSAPSSGLSISGPSTFTFTIGQAFAYVFSTNQGGAGFAWSKSVGTFPPGITFDPHPLSGGYILQGTPTGDTGSVTFTIRAYSASAGEVTRSYTCTINNATPLGAAPSSGALTPITGPGAYVSQTITLSGVPPFHVVPSTTPLGLRVDTSTLADGTFRFIGNPVKTGANLTISAIAEAGGAFIVPSYTITIADSAAPLRVSYPGLATMRVGDTVSASPVVTGGAVAPFKSFQALDGNLPTGLSIHPTTGVISGELNSIGVMGVYNCKIAIVDANDLGGITDISLTVQPGIITVDYDNNFISSRLQNRIITPTVGGAGSSGTLSWSATGLPPGVSIHPTTGVISGAPTVALPNAQLGYDSYPMVVTVTSSGGGQGTFTNGGSGYQVYGLNQTVALSIPGQTFQIPVGTPASPLPLTASGGSGNFTWRQQANTLPQSGVTFSTSTQRFTGTYGVAGSFNVYIRAIDTATGDFGDETYWLYVY